MTEEISQSNPEDGLHAFMHSESSPHTHIMRVIKILMVCLFSKVPHCENSAALQAGLMPLIHRTRDQQRTPCCCCCCCFLFFVCFLLLFFAHYVQLLKIFCYLMFDSILIFEVIRLSGKHSVKTDLILSSRGRY